MSDHPALRLVPELSELAAALFGRMQQPWMERAACAGKDPDEWFTDEVADLGEATVYPETVYDALRVCAACPVIRECITYAYQLEEEEHIPDPWVERDEGVRDRYGVYGVPGRVRERFASFPDRVERCLTWMDEVAASPQRRWRPPLKRRETA